MRAITAPQRALLGGRTIAYFQRIEVQNETGTWINLSNDPVAGHDWVDDCTFIHNIDQKVAAGTLTLKREIDDGTPLLSLAPFIVGSPLNVDDLAAYSPIIHPGRGFRVWLAPMAANSAEPAFPGTEWHKLFGGRLDRPQWGPGDTIVVQFRDLGANLADTIIEEERKYGSAAGVAVETVMRQILDDNGFTGVTVVLPGGSPGWMIRPEYKQPRVPVADALNALASQIAWDIRYRWGSGVDADTEQLHFQDPNRNAVFSDLVNGLVIGPDEYISVDDMQIGDDDVRNFGRLKFVDRLSGTPDEVTKDDPASILTFGRRYIEIGEAHTSNINSRSEAQDMIDGVIADLSTPFADHAISTFLLWVLELGDLLQFQPNDVHYTDAQTYAIVQIRTTLRGGHAMSTIQTRGKPAGGYRKWINMHGAGPGDPNRIPAPEFTYLLGEEAEGGGISGDGSVWIGVKFDDATEAIKFWGEEGDDANTPTPGIGTNTECLTLTRQEGVDSMARDWETIVQIATRPFRWRRIRAQGFGKNGEQGPIWTPPAVQAIDPTPTPVRGDIAAFSVTTGLLDDNILAVTPGTIDPGGGNYIVVRRDDVDIMVLFIDNDATQKFITDSAINPLTNYTYEVFIWNNGVSGVHRRWIAGLPTVPTFAWASGYPKLIWDISTSLYYVELQWSVSGYPTADHIVFEIGLDGVNFNTDIGQATIASTLKLDANLWPKWYRMRLEDASNTVLAYSIPRYWAGFIPPPSQGLVAPTWNPEPSVGIVRAPGVIGIPVFVIGFICATSGAATCVIQSSLDDGATDPWADEYESGQLAGDKWMGGAQGVQQWYRLVARDAAGVDLIASASKYWNGIVST